MIETSDIYRAINSLLTMEFPDIPIQDKDIKNPGPPCFCTQYVVGTTIQTACEYESTNCSFNIVYFSADSAIESLILVENKLKTVFKKPLKLTFLDGRNTQYQEIESVTTILDVENYTMQCLVNLSIDQMNSNEEGATDFIDRYDEFDNDEFIEELEI